MRLSKFNVYICLMRLDKPIGIFLLLWPALMALWIAGNGKPKPFIVGIFVIGVVIMRSAGCVINDLADREFDKAVVRTKERPLPIGALAPKDAIMLFGFLVLLAALLVFQLNKITVIASLFGLFLAMIYPFMKRYTALPQVVLGAAFGWAVPMAFTAVKSHITKEALLLYVITILWAVIYDTQYAMVDKKDDIKIGIKSTAILFGKWDKAIIGILQVIVLLLLSILGHILAFGKIYYFCLLLAGGTAIYQQYLIKDRIPKQCFKAFLNNNVFGALIFSGIALEYFYSHA